MEQEKKCIITITRQFGSLGRPIAKLVSEKLNIQSVSYTHLDVYKRQDHLLCLKTDLLVHLISS